MLLWGVAPGIHAWAPRGSVKVRGGNGTCKIRCCAGSSGRVQCTNIGSRGCTCEARSRLPCGSELTEHTSVGHSAGSHGMYSRCACGMQLNRGFVCNFAGPLNGIIVIKI